jgi:ADP-heptose:LPS heptosyltransferase
VTLGADVAVTSVVLDGAKQAFPDSRIWFVGPRKSWELFAGDPRLGHIDLAYGRGGTLRDRLAGWTELRDAVSRPSSIVIDPDSRLTQLGLLPVCPEENYYFFESRSYGGDGLEALPELTSRGMSETFGVSNARAYIRTGLPARPFAATASFGVGENPAKRIGDAFEAELVRELPRPALVDTGAGGEEGERVRRAVAQAGPGVEAFTGSFAAFASHVAASGHYVGYDSAGGHVAAACGIPLVCTFAGAVSDRMFARWRPWGKGQISVLRPTA